MSADLSAEAPGAKVEARNAKAEVAFCELMSFPKRSREAESSEKELAALKVEIASLRALIERQQNR